MAKERARGSGRCADVRRVKTTLTVSRVGRAARWRCRTPQTCNVVNICVNNAVVVMDVAMHCNAGDYYNVAIVPFFGRLWTSTTTLQPHRIVAVTIATLQRLDTAVAIACMRSVSRAIYHGTLLSVVAQAFWYG